MNFFELQHSAGYRWGSEIPECWEVFTRHARHKMDMFIYTHTRVSILSMSIFVSPFPKYFDVSYVTVR